MCVCIGCGDFDLPRRGSAGGAAVDDPWDDPWGVQDGTDEDEPRGHAARLDACEDIAHWDRLFARSPEEQVEVESVRLACLTSVNRDATGQLRSEHPEPERVDDGVTEHRAFGDAVCSLLTQGDGEHSAVRGTRCGGDVELALGRLFAAHAGLEDPIPLADRPWLYPDCDRALASDSAADAREFVDCIEGAVTQRFDRVAHELELVGASAADVAVLRGPRAAADAACDPFDGLETVSICPADWLMLGHHLIDRLLTD